MSTKVSLNDYISAKRSVRGRLERLRASADNRRFIKHDPSPLERIGCFESEISVMETTLKSMQRRLNNANIKVTIPDEK